MRSRILNFGILIAVFLSLFMVEGCSIFPMEEEELPPPIVKAQLDYRVVEAKVGTIINDIRNKIGTFHVPNNDWSKLYFEYTGPEADQLQIGTPAVVRYNNVEYPGEVYQTSAVSPEGTKVYARIKVFNVPSSIKINNQKGSFTAEINRKENVLKIYKNLVNMTGPKKTVQVLENNIKVVKEVETGFESSTEIEILGGITEGELVIVP